MTTQGTTTQGTLAWPLTRALATNPTGEAVVDGAVRLTYAQWGRRIHGLTAGLRNIGLRNGDYCINFGHDDANARVREILASDFDVDELVRTLQLTMLPGHHDAKQILSAIGASFAAAQQRGSKMLRLLGNIGWGLPDWPDEDAILEFEAAVTTAIKTLPAVVVCMYDARKVPGRAMFRGAFETHPLTICRNVMRENPHYVEAGEFIAALRSAR